MGSETEESRVLTECNRTRSEGYLLAARIYIYISHDRSATFDGLVEKAGDREIVVRHVLGRGT